MKTAMLLLAQYEKTLIPLEQIASEYLGCDPRTAANRAKANSLPFKAIRMGESQKAPWMVHIHDLATWIDDLRGTGKRANR